jgi:anti-sigma factor RsiW
MKGETLECAEIRSEFVAGRVPANLEVEEHLKACPQCRELFAHDAALGRRLAQAVLPEIESGDLFALVDREVQGETGVRARLRALPTRLRAMILGGVVLLLLATQIGYRHRPDFLEYEPLVFWGVVVLLGVALGVGVWRLLRGASLPLWKSSNERWMTLGLLATPVLAILLMPLGTSSPEWLAAFGRPELCFSHGALLSVPFVLIYWLFERRDRIPVSSWVMVGALAGISSNLLLHAICPSENLGHLLLGHATIGVAWALLLAALAKPLQRVGG